MNFTLNVERDAASQLWHVYRAAPQTFYYQAQGTVTQTAADKKSLCFPVLFVYLKKHSRGWVSSVCAAWGSGKRRNKTRQRRFAVLIRRTGISH